MKKTFVTLLFALVALTFVFWYRKTSDFKPLGNTLIVGTSSDYPPFSFRDLDNQIVGFDIDVVKEVGKRLNKNIDLQDRPFGTLLPQLELGQIHIIASGMTPTPERAKRVLFTKTYLSANPLLIVTAPQSARPTSLDDLKGKDVIVNTGFAADLYMSTLPDINLIRLPKVADALNALDQGKAYAFVTASFSLQPYIKDDKEKYAYLRLEETDEQNALALSKALPADFVASVQSALDAMQADGTLDALKQKWAVI